MQPILLTRLRCGTFADKQEADKVGSSIDSVMKDPKGALWLAATLDNAYPDVWGSAYLVALNLSTAARRQAAMDELVQHKSLYFQAGQVRSMPFPTLWTRCDFSPKGMGKINPAGCAPNGTYQVRAPFVFAFPRPAMPIHARCGPAEWCVLGDAAVVHRLRDARDGPRRLPHRSTHGGPR